MTREEYLENHDANEGAEEPTSVTRCPICGSDEWEGICRWKKTREIVGCNCCLNFVRSYDLDVTFVVKNGEIIGDDGAIEELNRWEWSQ